MTTLKRQQEEPLPEDPKLKKLLRGRVWKLIEWMTMKKPEDRPTSYRQVIEELIAIRDALIAAGQEEESLLHRVEEEAVPSPALHRPTPSPRTPSRAVSSSNQRTSGKFPLLLTLLFCGGVIGAGTFYFTHLNQSPVERVPPEKHAVLPPPPQEPVEMRPQITIRSQGRLGNLADLVTALQSQGVNIVLEDISPSQISAAYSFRESEPQSVLQALIIATGWDYKDDDGIALLKRGASLPQNSVEAARADLDEAALPAVNINSVAGNVTLRGACEAFRRDGDLDYLILDERLAEWGLPPVGLTATPLGKVLWLLQEREVPFVWTVQDGILILVPKVQ